MKTLINGKEIELFGRQELSAEFTKVVSDYLAKGFIFNYSEASSGSQGEKMKIDLSNDGGKTVYRIWMTCEYEKIDPERWENVDVISIIVKKYDGKKSTFWFSEGEIISEKKFYKISLYSSDASSVYCQSKEEYFEIRNLRNKRWENHRGTEFDEYNNEKELPEKYFKLVIKCARKLKGWKSVQLKDVKKVYRKIGYGYEIVFNNGKWCSVKVVKK